MFVNYSTYTTSRIFFWSNLLMCWLISPSPKLILTYQWSPQTCNLGLSIYIKIPLMKCVWKLSILYSSHIFMGVHDINISDKNINLVPYLTAFVQSNSIHVEENDYYAYLGMSSVLSSNVKSRTGGFVWWIGWQKPFIRTNQITAWVPLSNGMTNQNTLPSCINPPGVKTHMKHTFVLFLWYV